MKMFEKVFKTYWFSKLIPFYIIYFGAFLHFNCKPGKGSGDVGFESEIEMIEPWPGEYTKIGSSGGSCWLGILEDGVEWLETGYSVIWVHKEVIATLIPQDFIFTYSLIKI